MEVYERVALTRFGEEAGAHGLPLGSHAWALAGRLLPSGGLTGEGREREVGLFGARRGGEDRGVLVEGKLAGGAGLGLEGGQRQLVWRERQFVGGRQGNSALLWGRPQQTQRGVAPILIT